MTPEHHRMVSDVMSGLSEREYRTLVRDRLLPESQRHRFETLMASYVEDLL